MKQTEKSKQTVWVLTMLTVMLVLSVYYLLSDPIVSTDFANNDITNEAANQIDISADITTEDIASIDLSNQTGTTASDLLTGLRMERDNNRAKQLDQLYMMMENDLSEEAIVGIKNEIEDLETLEEAEFILEKLLVTDGYDDALVLTNKDNVDVIVNVDKLDDTEAVRIIKLVSDRLEIPATNVHIKTIK